ncbi:BAG family molecular chaperone regulator 1-like [Ipomoea triloba]|uniref:BAG family molecular chaperone regulator 1-like n=1 Tax=Ipomoea triloba TaxID=35885 RepID=UPI00125CEB42|nr:BAG family molecular chaperone regulator 1-like [Ipomoea triloba]
MNKDMLRTKKTKSGVTGALSPAKSGGRGGDEVAVWEVRPGGMLVQKRSSDCNQSSVTIPTIKVKVKYGSSYHEAKISSQASFGELKKVLAGATGLHPEEQKLMYKERERDSRAFLDVAGVKDGSKLVLMEDEVSRERRYLESQKTAKMEAASREIKAVRLGIDKLAKQVADVEMDVYGGKKVAETVILNMIELLMMELIKLDGIAAEGDVKLQRRMQVKRVQKYIETLDMLKVKNCTLQSNSKNIRVAFQQQHRIITTGQILPPAAPMYNQQKHKNIGGGGGGRFPAGPVVVTTQWETF